MKRLALLAVMTAAACDPAMQTAAPGAGGGMREQLVLGSRMSFEECKARGGLIIKDQGSPMVACDPHVQGPVTPDDEFNHPDTQG